MFTGIWRYLQGKHGEGSPLFLYQHNALVDCLRECICKMKKTRFHTKWFSWLYTILAVIGLFLLAFSIYPYLEGLRGTHNDPNCPDSIYHAIWFVIVLIVIPILYGWSAIIIWYILTHSIEANLSIKKMVKQLSIKWEWWIVPLLTIVVGALFILFLWLFSTQFWVWILILTPGAVLGVIYGKRRL